MQYVLKKPIMGNPLIWLTIIVFLSPVLIQITGNNYLKMIEDAAYLVLLLHSVNHIFKKRDTSFKVSKSIMFLMFLISIFALISIYYNGFLMVLIQFREYKYLLLLLIIIPYKDKNDFELVWPTLKAIAALCVPVAFIQWLIYKANGDLVTGLLGYGGSGTLTLFLLIVFFSEMCIRLKNYKRVFGAYFMFLIPTALNETKITIILIPVMLLTTLLISKRLNFSNLVYMAVIMSLLLAGWAYLYKNTYGKSLSEVFSPDYVDNYMYATDWEGDVGRLAKVSYALEVISDKNMLFGYGLGAAYLGASSGAKGYILNKFYSPEMFEATRPQLFISLIDTGVIGTGLIIILLIIYFIKVLLTKGLSLEKVIAINTFILIFATFVYQPIFYTYQIMYILMFYMFMCLGIVKK